MTKRIVTIQARRFWVRVKDVYSHSDKLKHIYDIWTAGKKGLYRSYTVNPIPQAPIYPLVPPPTPPLTLRFEREICISVSSRGQIHAEWSGGQVYYAALSNNWCFVPLLKYLQRGILLILVRVSIILLVMCI